MKILLQRVDRASVTVGNECISSIDTGYLALVGCRESDTPEDADRLAARIAALRVFEDDAGRMNRSVRDVDGSVLAVSQFTLYADLSKGNRPSFNTSGDPAKAEVLYERFVADLRTLLGPEHVQTGRFGADMSVALVNNGPCTFELLSETALTPTQSPKPQIPSPALTFQQVKTDEDARLVLDIVRRVWPICYAGIITQAQIDSMLGWMYDPEVIRKETAAGTPFYLVLADGVPAGVCSFDTHPDAEGGVELHKVYTLPQYWGRGFGHALLLEVAERIRACGGKSVYLRVNKKNLRAQKAYKAAGFFREKAVCTDIPDGFVMDDFIYRKPL